MRCIAEFNENDNYVGDGWVSAAVASTNGVFLGCGDERSGVIHVAHPESTGNVHPVTAGNEKSFLECFGVIAGSGKTRPDNNFPDTRTRYEYTYYVDSAAGPIPRTASLVKDNAGGFVYTIFTSTSSGVPQGNDWYNCTKGIASP